MVINDYPFISSSGLSNDDLTQRTDTDNIKSSLNSGSEEWDISQMLSMLPKKRISANFDRKMAAAFALELEKEIQRENAKKTYE